MVMPSKRELPFLKLPPEICVSNLGVLRSVAEVVAANKDYLH